MPKDQRANLKISKETHEELNRYARKLAVQLDRKVTIDEAIMHAIQAGQVKEKK